MEKVNVIPSLFNMPELLLCGVGNEIIYDKEKETRQLAIDGLQRTHNDWGKLDLKQKLIVDILKG